MTVVKPWSGRAVMRARAYMATFLPAPCGQCNEPVTAADAWVVGHIIAREIRPDLTWEPTNWRHEHRSCSNKSAQSVVIEKARAEGVTATLAALGMTDQPLPGMPSFPTAASPGKPPPLPFSPPEAKPTHIETRPELEWNAESLSAFAWLLPFLDVPDDASPPRFMTPPPADAVGSYGVPDPDREVCPEGAIAWIEKAERKRLRWWQKLAIVRQLEHRADGSLCHRFVIESAPRRAGKSVRVRGVALWRLAHADLFGEVQTVVHTGSDVAICREIQRGAWRWAEDVAGWEVGRANGKEAVETPDGDRWLVRAQTAVYGYDVCLGIGDECWDVDPGTVSEGLEPASLERSSPQIHLTSTAHTRATSLMPRRIAAVLARDVPRTLLLMWCAPFDADPGDESAWRSASPHWTEDRHELVASKYEAALAGEVDPDADDPDPMRGFLSQYLNVWSLRHSAGRAQGEQLVTDERWAALVAAVPHRTPAAVAIESWFGAGVSLALAWAGDGRAVVAVTECADLAGAAAAVKALGYRGTVIVGESHLKDPALKGLRTEAGRGRAAQAAQDLQRLIGADLIRHDGKPHLAAQVAGLRTVPGRDGPRLVSKARADAVKAAVWAAEAARIRPARNRPQRIIVARSA